MYGMVSSQTQQQQQLQQQQAGRSGAVGSSAGGSGSGGGSVRRSGAGGSLGGGGGGHHSGMGGGRHGGGAAERGGARGGGDDAGSDARSEGSGDGGGSGGSNGSRSHRHYRSGHRSVYRRLLGFVKQAWTGVKFALDSELEECECAPRYRPDSLEALRRATRFSESELKRIYRGFKAECPTGVVREDTFKGIYSQFFPQGANTSQYAHYVFKTLDQDNSGLLSFEDFVHALSILSRGSVEEKLRWAFALYDVDGDGKITKDEMAGVVSAVYDLMGASTAASPSAASSPPLARASPSSPSTHHRRRTHHAQRHHTLLPVHHHHRGQRGAGSDGERTGEGASDGRVTPTICIVDDAAAAVNERVEALFQKMDRNGDGVVTLEEFVESCLHDEHIPSSMAVFDSSF